MKVGLVCPLLSFIGGVQRHTLLLGEVLQQHGIEVVYISPTPQESPGLPTNHVQLGSAVVLPNLNGSWNDYSVTTQSKEELRQLIIDLKIDILHFQALVVPFAAWQLLEASPVINIATLLSGWEKTSPVESIIPVFELLVKNLKEKLTQTIAISETALQSERYFVDENTRIIPTPIDVAAFTKVRKKPKTLSSLYCNLIFVGRLDKRKGFLQLLSAINALPQEIRTQVKLHVIGQGPLEWRGRHYCLMHDLDSTVFFHGRLSEAAKLAYLQHGDIFIAPSVSGESFGIVLTEAMAAGIPIICGNTIGYKETMQSYPAQEMIVDPNKPRIFAKAITKLVIDKKLRHSLGKWGKVYVKKFDVHEIVRQHAELYQQLISNQS